MKDILLDIVQYSHGLGVIDLVKVSGTETETRISAVADDKSVIFSGVMSTPIPDFLGVFGMPNLSKLKTILSFTEYDDKSQISVVRQTRDNEELPTTIHFATQHNDFVNDYRLMSRALVEERVKNVTFKGATWNINFEPQVNAIQRFKKQVSANSEQSTFTSKTVANELRFYFGDPSTHSGSLIFHSNLTGSLTREHQWPVKQFMAIMDFPGSKRVDISDQGVMSITVNSGIAVYTYLLPAQAK